jgi:hypothetical protein
MNIWGVQFDFDRPHIFVGLVMVSPCRVCSHDVATSRPRCPHRLTDRRSTEVFFLFLNNVFILFRVIFNIFRFSIGVVFSIFRLILFS